MIRDESLAAESPQHELILKSLSAGIDRAHPETIIENSVSCERAELTIKDSSYDLKSYDRIFIVGGGNAAAHVAKALEKHLSEFIEDGLVVTDDPVSLSMIDCIQGSHPVPDRRAADGAKRIVEVAQEATADDLVICIVTGGGSALLPAPVEGVSLADLQSITEQLLISGSSIDEINAVRKHLSAIKGGQLARAGSPGTLVGLVFSDVVGNDLSVIASGPLAADETTYQEAIDIIDRYKITPPEGIERRLKQGSSGKIPETPTVDDPIFETVENHILADNLAALQAAKTVLSDSDYTPVVLSSRIRGEAKDIAKAHVGIAEEILATSNPVAPPAALLSGGETTVTVTGDGDGGPNQEFALSAAIELTDQRIVVGSIDSDGIDGNVNAAGALVDANTVSDQRLARTALEENDTFATLEKANAVLDPGQTGTNVNDLRITLISE